MTAPTVETTSISEFEFKPDRICEFSDVETDKQVCDKSAEWVVWMRHFFKPPCPHTIYLCTQHKQWLEQAWAEAINNPRAYFWHCGCCRQPLIPTGAVTVDYFVRSLPL